MALVAHLLSHIRANNSNSTLKLFYSNWLVLIVGVYIAGNYWTSITSFSDIIASENPRAWDFMTRLGPIMLRVTTLNCSKLLYTEIVFTSILFVRWVQKSIFFCVFTSADRNPSRFHWIYWLHERWQEKSKTDSELTCWIIYVTYLLCLCHFSCLNLNFRVLCYLTNRLSFCLVWITS